MATNQATARRDIHEEVTAKIVAALERGVIPWRSPILGAKGGGIPANLVSKRPYSGINSFLLALSAWGEGYTSRHWLTFKQALDLGGSVRKGQKSTLIVFYRMFDTKDKQTGEDKHIPMLRHYNVFNVDQCDGIKSPDAAPYTPLDFSPIEEAQRIVEGFDGCPTIEHSPAGRAFYRPSADLVHMPERTRFASVPEYYSTLFHELSHSTGHKSRLNRKADGAFGSGEYAKEELVAEMSAAFLCAEAGIAPATIENHAAYVAGWLKALKDDRKLVVGAASAGQKSANWILGERGEGHAESVPVEAMANA